MAATRARDLLVVAAIGEEDRQGGWLSPLHDALYPPKDRWRISGAAPGCPKFGGATVLNRPPDQPEEVSVKPGLHYPKAGGHTVVWFDPAVLALRVAKAEGVENEQVLSGTTEEAVEGLRRYQEWKDGRAQRLESGAVPRYRVAAAETFGAAAEAAQIPVETVTLPLAAGPSHRAEIRPRGARYSAARRVARRRRRPGGGLGTPPRRERRGVRRRRPRRRGRRWSMRHGRCPPAPSGIANCR